MTQPKSFVFFYVLVIGLLLCTGTYAQSYGPLNDIAFDLLPNRNVRPVYESYNVAIIADAHIDPLGTGSPSDWDGSLLEEILDQFDTWDSDGSQSNDIAFVIMAGDFINSYCTGTPNSLAHYYDNMYDYMDATGIPVFHVMGNHEIGGNLYGDGETSCWLGEDHQFQNFFDYFGATDYVIDFGDNDDWNDRFVIINDTEYITHSDYHDTWCSSIELYNETCSIPHEKRWRSYYYTGSPDYHYRFSILDDQFEFLEDAFSANNRFEFGVVHIPVYDGYNDGGKNDQAAYEDYRDVLYNYDVSGVFYGHAHTWRREQDWYDAYNYIWHIEADDNKNAASEPAYILLQMSCDTCAYSPYARATACKNADCSSTNWSGSWVIDTK